jgi:hypothetical protein
MRLSEVHHVLLCRHVLERSTQGSSGACEKNHIFVRWDAKTNITLRVHHPQIKVYGFSSGRSVYGDGFAMPRYFFNTRIGDDLIADPEGEHLRDPDHAWEIARAMIGELLKTEGTGGGLLQAVLEVTDDHGDVVMEFPFTEAILDASGEPMTKH